MNTSTALSLLGITVGFGLAGVGAVYPSTMRWMMWAGLLLSALITVLWIRGRRRSVGVKMKDCTAIGCGTAIAMSGDAKLDSDNFTSIGNGRLLDMRDRAEAKMRNTYHEAAPISDVLKSSTSPAPAPAQPSTKSSAKGWRRGFKLPWT